MDRTHPPKTNQQCHEAGLRLESTRKKKNRQTQNYLEEINRRGSKDTWNQLERNEESSKQQSALEKSRFGPMLYLE